MDTFILEIVKLLGGIILGGGASWLFFFKRKRKQMINKMASDDYEEYSDNLTNFMERLTAMSEKVNSLLNANQQLYADNVKLANELERIRDKCSCGAVIKEKHEHGH